MNYAFRIKFYVSQAGAISSNNHEKSDPTLNGKTVKITGNKGKLSESSEINIDSYGYSSEEEAIKEGEKIKKAILVACFLKRIFVDVGKDQATIKIGKEVKEKLWNAHQVESIEEVHGLNVYDSSKKIQFCKGGKPELFNSINPNDFIKDIESLLSPSTCLDDKLLLAFELYGASGFEKSPRSRFLTLMLAIESMIERKKRPPEIINIIKSFEDILESLKKLLDSTDLINMDKIKSIKNGISDLKQESITKSGQNLSETLLGSKKYSVMTDHKRKQKYEASEFFKHCYDIRGKLVHSGKSEISDNEFSALTSSLEGFVHDLLKSKMDKIK